MRIAQTTVRRVVNGSRISLNPNDLPLEADHIVEHFVRCGVLRPRSQVTSHVLTIFAVPPEELRVTQIARCIGVSRRTLGRRFQTAGIPSPAAWVALARAVRAHRSILRGAPLAEAAAAAGYSDQFAMSNAIHRITGLRPSRLREVSREELLDTWIVRQRERGTLTGPPPVPPRICPLCKLRTS